MKSLHWLLLGLLLACGKQTPSVAGEPTPQPKDVFDYALGTFGTFYDEGIHNAKNEQEKQGLARDWYRMLFMIWYGADHHVTGNLVNLSEFKGYIHAFQRSAVRNAFQGLVDFNDLIGYGRLPKNYDIQGFLNFLGGMEYYKWVIEQTEQSAKYHQAVRAFLDYTASVNPKDYP